VILTVLAEVALAPAGVVTLKLTCPAACAGATAVSCVAEMTVTAGDPVALEPNVTCAPATKPVPVTITVFPPAVGPALGLTPVNDGCTS
jgi:hypothetical protein